MKWIALEVLVIASLCLGCFVFGRVVGRTDELAREAPALEEKDFSLKASLDLTNDCLRAQASWERLAKECVHVCAVRNDHVIVP